MPMGPLQIFGLMVGKGLQDILNYCLCMTHLQNFNSLGIKRRFREDAEGLQDVLPGVHLVLGIRLINKIFHKVAEGVQDVVLAVHLVPGGRLRPISSTATLCTGLTCKISAF